MANAKVRVNRTRVIAGDARLTVATVAINIKKATIPIFKVIPVLACRSLSEEITEKAGDARRSFSRSLNIKTHPFS